MSTKKLSPAARLLRQSRLFAMPPPVPPPPTTSIIAPPASPHPTLQAITTPRSSAFRGDWGLKRDLPLATSQKTTYMRYGDLDTIEHMTTFESAHDDVYTLKKWQEMDIALEPSFGEYNTYGMETSFNFHKTVFDDDKKPERYKWRYGGQFIEGMSQNELREYIKKEIVPRKDEFYAFVAKRQNIDELRRKYDLEGVKVSIEQLEDEASEMPDAKVDLLALRADPVYLERLVTDFLDIPVTKPHRTHPSAGLHYTRSNAYAYNHPELGPQENRLPVQGRALNWQPGNGAVAGVGGVVAKVYRAYGRGLRNDDRATVNKYVPMKATIDARGRIMMEVQQVLQPSDMYGGTASRFLEDRKAARVADPSAATMQRKIDMDTILDLMSSRGAGRA